jgi:exportin-2 (importin alpha re-exporter)
VVFPILVKNLADNNNFVVQTYAAACLEKMLIVKDQGVSRFGKADLKPHLEGVLTNLFRVLSIDQSKENDYVMKGKLMTS